MLKEHSGRGLSASHRMAQAFERLGFSVSEDVVLSSSGFAADIVATRGNQTLVVEVKDAEYIPSHTLYELRSLRNELTHAEARFAGALVALATTSHLPDQDIQRFERGGVHVLAIGETADDSKRNAERFLLEIGFSG